MGFTTVIIITSGIIFNCHKNHFWGFSSSKMTISGQIEVKNYSDKPILRFILSIVFFVDIWADFCGKLARFREFLTHIGIFEHFWDIFDPFPIQKAQFFVENLTWTYIGWHQKLFYGLQSLRNHVISHCYSRRTLISINLLKNQNSIQMGTLSLIH